MQTLKKIIYIFVLVFSISILNVKASAGYTIDKFDIDVKVNNDNTFDIKETILANFNTSKHGIYRTIPLENQVTREDGSSYINKVKISNVKVNEEFTTSRENGNYIIRIGSFDRTLTGLKEYEISYHYNIGNDKNKNFDELYYNLIGTNWDTTISDISFKITMPKDFDESKLGFSAGSYGSSGTSYVSYEVNSNVITGTFNHFLNPSEALTVRLELPDGYFAKQMFNIMEYMNYILPFIFLGISILLWYLYGRDEKPIETIEFYPPKDKNSLEVGFLYKGKASPEDVTSLLVYLANKGYLKISEDDEYSFKIIKVREYDGNNEEEKKFLEGLFKKSSKDSEGREFVTRSDLYDSFYLTVKRILRSTNSMENKNLIFEKMYILKAIYIIMYILTIIITLFLPFKNYDLVTMIMFIVTCIGFGLFNMVLSISDSSITLKKKLKNALITLIALVIALPEILYILKMLPMITSDVASLFEYPILTFLDFLCAVGILIFYRLLSKRNKYGTEMLGKLKGFKTFLETAEKEKLEAMVKDNPTYFYDILPFTYVLGVSSTWIKKFEVINMEAPDWYYGVDAFDIITFNRFIDRTVTSSMTSRTIDSSDSASGGGFSGGGFSGGGSGGGGGGSW